MFPKVFLPVLIALLAYVSCALAFRQQVVGVEGRLMCGSQPLNNTQVKLWSKNKLGRFGSFLMTVKNPKN